MADACGIPGDYVLTCYGMLEASSINVIGCTHEDCAAFATDAYARIRGLGELCVTYWVGGLSFCNSIAEAYAENSPLVLLTGSPGLNERQNNPLLHHMVRDFRSQIDVSEKLCVAGTNSNDPTTPFREIERVLHRCHWDYNEIHGWDHHRLPELLGGGTSYLVETEGDFDHALSAAWAATSGFSLLHVRLTISDARRTLTRLAERLGRRVRGKTD